MPATRFDRFRQPAPPPDMLRELFNRYQKARGINADAMGQRLGISGAAVRQKKCRGTATWTVADVVRWCRELGIDSPEEIGAAILNTGTPLPKGRRA